MKKRKELTPEQIAARDARREKFRGLCKQVAAMTDEQRAQLAEKMGAVLTCEGRALSCKNSCLLFYQLPAVSVVGGFRQWIAQGRAVRKGERGGMIWIPLFGKTDADGEPTGAEGDERKFGTVTVFDISQTDEITDHEDPAESAPAVSQPAGRVEALELSLP